ncbi:YbjN domain-containing protein [Corynebacterium auriscanis]|uniref:YbjN domain-containing protein n=1 Tax=Corynebacterium auriscanis TaxID=99807 RepID=UPI003CF5E5A0
MDRKGICTLLDQAQVEYQEHEDNVVVVLPGEKRLKTNCIFIPQQGTFRVEAFICRKVEEAHEEVYKLLLQANRRSLGVHYTLDHNNDIYLVGQFPDSTTADDIQRILGQVLERADADFNRILERGFASSIRHEWAWRLSRGEPTFNLAAFAHLKPSEAEVSLLAPPPGSKLASNIHNPREDEPEDKPQEDKRQDDEPQEDKSEGEKPQP